MSLIGKRVLITGSSGFTGRYMVQALQARGYDVYGIGAGSDPGLLKDSHYRCVDLTDARAVHEVMQDIAPDILVHLAAVAFVASHDIASFYQVNIMGTRHLLESLANSRHAVEKVLLASSANIYGNTSEGLLPETTLPAPANDYAVSKLAMEYMAHLWQPKLPITITRPFNYTGVGQSEQFLIPKIVHHFKHRKDRIELGNLDVWRDFSDVRYVTEVYADLLELPPQAKPINVCSGRKTSLRDILALCTELSGHELAIDINPQFVRSNDVKVLGGDPSRLQALIGHRHAVIDLRDTLSWMLDH